ncbi:MAG: hypothetical protein AAF721_14915 [Myxococcota bacterium]
MSSATNAAPAIPTAVRASGVIGGLLGAAFFSYAAWSLMRWLQGPLDKVDAIIVVVTFGAVIPFGWLCVVLSIIFVGVSGHAVVDALGSGRGHSAGRLLVVAGLATAWGLARADFEQPGRSDILLTGSAATIFAANLAFVVLYARWRRSRAQPTSAKTPS